MEEQTTNSIPAIKENIGACGLLSTLLIAVSLTLPGALSDDDFTDLRERYPEYRKAATWRGDPRSDANDAIWQLATYNTISVNMLGSAVIVVVLVAFTIACVQLPRCALSLKIRTFCH